MSDEQAIFIGWDKAAFHVNSFFLGAEFDSLDLTLDNADGLGARFCHELMKAGDTRDWSMPIIVVNI